MTTRRLCKKQKTAKRKGLEAAVAAKDINVVAASKGSSTRRKVKHRDQRSQTADPRSIEELLNLVQPEPLCVSTADACLGNIQLITRQLLGEKSTVVVQGSYAQGLALSTSDLDVAIIRDVTSPAPAGEPASVSKKEAQRLLYRFVEVVDALRSPDLRVAKRIFSARVPVLRLIGKQTAPGPSKASSPKQVRLTIDVSVGGNLRRGAADRCIRRLLQADPSGTAAALCRLVKLWCKRRGLTDTLRGGLSSFGFVLLAIFFLQRLPQSAPVPSSSRLPTYDRLGSDNLAAPKDGVCPPQLNTSVAGMESRLVWLLEAFYVWAERSWPYLPNQVVSVVSGRSAARPGSTMLFIEVPYDATENAARCLRAAVWEGTILPEVTRAKRLVQKLSDAADKAKVLLALYGKQKETVEAEDDFEVSSSQMEAGSSRGWKRKRRRSMSAELLEAQGAGCEDDAEAQPRNLCAPDHGTSGRWLGLRALLDPVGDLKVQKDGRLWSALRIKVKV